MTPGDKISHYEILKLLGKGGMGEVYLAHDTVLDRDVAIKFLPESIQHDPAIRERFLREAKAAAALDHPFICKIYETSVFEGRSYIVMEYVEGHNLQERMKEKKIAARDALQVALEIAEALEIAHAKGIVHRDLKPANIMCTPQGHAKVMDFGIAKRVLPVPESVSATLTQTAVTVQGTIMGTIDYLSPEQAKGAPVDGRSDIFSLGIVLYEMLSGKHPFSKSTPIETLSAVIRDPVPAVSIKPKSVNPAVHHILKKCLAKNPADRYPKIADFSAELRKVREEIGAGVPFFLRGWRAAVSAVILIAAGLAIWRFVLPPKVSAPQPEQKPVSVLVADFKNQTADPVFDGSLEYALGVGLEAAPFITTYRRPNARQIASQLNPEAKGRLDAEMAQLVCVREGINMFMDGAIEPKGGGYVLKVWARDPLNAGKATEYSRDIPSKKEVLTAAAWLSNKIIADLGGTPAKSAQELAGETFTTSSLEAINAYTKAQELSIIGKQEEAMEEYFKIIKLDPNFGRAYSGLAILYRNRGQLAECEKYFNLALAKIDQMGEREKFRTMAMYYLMQRNSQKAIQELTELLAKYPADYAGRTNLALAYFYAHNFSEAKKVGRQAVELYPNNSLSRFNLSWYALADSDLETAEQEAQKVIDQSPKYEKAYVVLALSKFLKGEVNQAVEVYDKLKLISAVGESFALMGMADIALYDGRLSRATELLEKEIASAAEKGRKEYLENKWALLGHARLQNKKISSALEAADRAAAGTKEMGTLIYAALLYTEAGKEERARSLAAELSKQLGPEPRAYAKIIEGEILKKQGKTNEAIVLFNQAQEILDTWLGRFSLGKAYIEAAAFPDAYRELDSCLKRHGEAASVFFNDVPSIHYLPLIYYYRGRAQEGLKSDAAKESYQQFLQIKANADKGDPLVEDCLKRLVTSR